MKSIAFLFGLIICVPFLSAQSWIRQNPFPQLAMMEDLDFDGSLGIAVGDESTIFTTTNGGTSWMPRKAPQAGSLYQAALVVPGTFGQLMFAGGYDLIISNDGGQSWGYTNAPVQLVYKIQALTDGSILVLDSDYALRSIDNGETWETINMPGTNITAGHFTSALHGWVQYGGFENNQVWVTTDGGVSWNVRDPLKHPVIAAIEMLNDQVGFLGSRDFVYKTIDGGNSWIKMHDTPVYSILDLHAVNENEIWTCQNNGFIFFTLDGGANWTDINPNIISSNKTNGIFADATGKVWVAGKFVSLMYSANYGADWTDQIPNAKTIMYQPHFFDENTGIIGSSAGTILKTINGGASWDRIQLDPDENFFAVQMVSEQAIVVGSSSGRVFGSVNQGDTWLPLGEGLGQITDIHAFTLQSAVVTSESGKIFKTDNAGSQWDEVYVGSSDILLGMDFTGNQQGWACGWNGRILHTEDGGENWVSQHFDGRSQFEDIDFTTPDEGWVVSSAFTDTIWHTENGGTDWAPVVVPYRIFWRSVSFTNQDTGWIAGGSAGFGIILRTNDGGQTWNIDHQSPEALFGVYAVPQKETAWACGVGGNIVKFSPCTFSPALSGLTGDLIPCQYDTIAYSVSSSDVDIFEWSYPADWLVYGNSNTSSIQLIIGAAQGEVSVKGSDACGNTADALSLQANPILVPGAVITENNGELICNLDSGFYQWFLDGTPIPNANQQSYSPVTSGFYEVVVTSFTSGCLSRSNGIEILINGVADLKKESLHIFPNPAGEMLNFSLADITEFSNGFNVSIFTNDGRKIYMGSDLDRTVDISNLPAGIYYLRVQTARHLFQEIFLVQRGK